MSRTRDHEVHLAKRLKRRDTMRVALPSRLLATPLRALGADDDTRTVHDVLRQLPRAECTLAQVKRQLRDRHTTPQASLACAAAELLEGILRNGERAMPSAEDQADWIAEMEKARASAQRSVAQLAKWGWLSTAFGPEASVEHHLAAEHAKQTLAHVDAMLTAARGCKPLARRKASRETDALFLAWRAVAQVAASHGGFKATNARAEAVFSALTPQASHRHRTKNANTMRVALRNGEPPDLAELFWSYAEDFPLD